MMPWGPRTGARRGRQSQSQLPPHRGARRGPRAGVVGDRGRANLARVAAGGVRLPRLRAAVGERLTRLGAPRRELVGGSSVRCFLIVVELDDLFARVRCWTVVVAHVEEAEQQQPLRGQKTEDVVRLEPERLLLVTRARHPPLRFRT